MSDSTIASVDADPEPTQECSDITPKTSAHDSDALPVDTLPFRCGTIAIVGRPNVGKSTLLNALIGHKISITSRKAQTTRHPITGIVTTSTAQFIFVDTPGFQIRHRGALNHSLNRAVKATLASVDVVLYIVEAGSYGADDDIVLHLLPGMETEHNASKEESQSELNNNRPTVTPVLLAIANKLDRIADRSALPEFLEHLSGLRSFAECIALCAKRPDDVQSLLQTIERYLPCHPPMYEKDALTAHSERFLASEILREKIFRHTGEELPYQTTVSITQFIQEGRLRRIFATIFVERATHRVMLLGTKGSKLKQINTEAREDMMRLFDSPVYLEVWVKVKKGNIDQTVI